ncbi:MAG: hypothetical protein EOO40_11610 [Deltaproteobacteria bacterium]|nr:MAG: hypothetical protein EOO40_11610 [Deltaproteobacteria bacterium]
MPQIPHTPLLEAHQADIIPLTPLRVEVTRALQRRGKKLLEAADLPAQMALLSPLEAYLTIKELGIEAAMPLFACATAAQLQACIDLDCWEHDNFEASELDARPDLLQSISMCRHLRAVTYYAPGHDRDLRRRGREIIEGRLR